MTDDELKAAVETASPGTRNGTCEFVLANTTPSDWKIAIVAAGVNFTYADGTVDTVQPENFILVGGSKYSFFSKKPAGCVKKIFLAITVLPEGETAKSDSMDWTDGDPKECMRIRGAEYGPKNNIAEGELSISRSVLDLQLRSN